MGCSKNIQMETCQELIQICVGSFFVRKVCPNVTKSFLNVEYGVQ